MSATPLTYAEASQLMAYLQWAEEEGCYYGNLEHFNERHKKLKKWLQDVLEELRK